MGREGNAEIVSSERAPRVAVSILNWHGWRETVECLESVQAQEYPNYLAVVTDNGSRDESAERLRGWAREKLEALADYTRAEALRGGTAEQEEALERAAAAERRLALIRNEENLGFAGGHNVAIEYALKRRPPADYVFLLNNDARVEKDCLTHLVAVGERTGAGIAGATIRNIDDGRVMFGWRTSLVRQFFTPLVSWRLPPPKTHDGYWPSFFVSGAGLLARREALEAVRAQKGEYWPSRLFMYMEEEALSFATQKAGYETVVASSAVVRHRGPRKLERGYNPLHYYYQARNRVLLAGELLPAGWRAIFHLVTGPLVAARAAKRALHREWYGTAAMLRGLADGYRGVTGKWKEHDRWAMKRLERPQQAEGYEP